MVRREKALTGRHKTTGSIALERVLPDADVRVFHSMSCGRWGKTQSPEDSVWARCLDAIWGVQVRNV